MPNLNIQNRFIYKIAQHITLKNWQLKINICKKIQLLKIKKTKERQSHSRTGRKKEDLKNKNLAHLPKDDLKEALRNERELRK